jgi:hypothetical protein
LFSVELLSIFCVPGLSYTPRRTAVCLNRKATRGLGGLTAGSVRVRRSKTLSCASFRRNEAKSQACCATPPLATAAREPIHKSVDTRFHYP